MRNPLGVLCCVALHCIAGVTRNALLCGADFTLTDEDIVRSKRGRPCDIAIAQCFQCNALSHIAIAQYSQVCFM